MNGLYNGIVWIVNKIIDAINSIPGVELDNVEYSNLAEQAYSGLMDRVDERNEKLAGMVNDMNALADEINKNKATYKEKVLSMAGDINVKQTELDQTRNDRVAHRNDWINGVKGALENALNTNIADPLSNISNNTGNTAGNTGKISDTLDATEEDLQYLRDIAERETINRFTTAEIKVDFTSHNNINSEMDIDGIVDSLGKKLEERLEVVAEGVYI